MQLYSAGVEGVSSLLTSFVILGSYFFSKNGFIVENFDICGNCSISESVIGFSA